MVLKMKERNRLAKDKNIEEYDNCSLGRKKKRGKSKTFCKLTVLRFSSCISLAFPVDETIPPRKILR